MAAKSQTDSKTGTKKPSKKPKSVRKVTKPASTAGKGLVIVESPAKARTVGQILGRKYVVVASQGHMRDLPKSKLGVDVEQDFEPSYVVMQDKRSWLNALKKAGDEAASIYLATDPVKVRQFRGTFRTQPNGANVPIRPNGLCSTRLPSRPYWRRSTIQGTSTCNW